MTEHIAFEGHNALRIEIVTKLEQIMHVMAVRAICYMEDTTFPANQAFDGNDFQCTHVVAYLQDEPVGACRIRWFKDFAKIERTAFRKSHRSIPYIKQMATFTFAHIARKGYGVAMTHASPLFARLWRMHFGFRDVPGKPAVEYHGEKYIELVRQLDIPSNVITSDTEVAVLFRTEGEWDTPAKYEAH